MANKKLTDLTELTTPADNDFLYIVDVSDTTESAQGTSKKIRKDKVDSGASKENIANKSDIYTTDTEKYYSATYVNGVLPTSYSKIVYVNATSPTTATIFDTENPPVTNDNALKNDTANLYIGTDASTWVYLTGTGYVTKTVSSATSNFNTFGTSVDAGNSKTSHITRSGAMTLAGPLNILNLKIATTPTTSAGSYDILTRNSSTTALEKKLVSDFLQTTGNQTKTGRLSFLNTSGYTNGINLTNTASGTGVSSNAITINNNGTGGSGGAIANSNGGTGLYFESYNGKAIDMMVTSPSGSGSGINLRSDAGNTGNLLNAVTGKVVINSVGKLSTTEAPTGANDVTNKTYVDAKITQTITNGVTDKSPSEDAVFDALVNVTRNIVKDVVPSSAITGTITETILKSYLIPANTFSSSDALNIPSLGILRTGTNGSATVRIYINTSNSLTGAVRVANYLIASANEYTKIDRHYNIYNGNLIGFLFTATWSPTDILSNVALFSSTPINVSNNFYIITTIQLANSLDVLTQNSFLITN